MALTDENGGIGATMLVQPSGFNGGSYGVPYAVPTSGGFGGFGGDFGGLIVLFLIAAMFGGFGGGWGGFGANGMMNYDFPWLLNGQNGINNNVNSGFRDSQLYNQISDARIDINRGFGDVNLGIAGINQNICQTGNGIVKSVSDGFSSAEIAANARHTANMQQMYNNEIASLNRSFAEQTANAQGFNNVGLQLCQASADNRLATANISADIAREACATRTSDTQNTQLILNAINDGFRAMSDQRYQDKIDAKNDEIAQLRQENLYARGQASQIAQNTQIVDGIYNRLNTCPVGTTPVFGNQPIFTCAQNVANSNVNCGCGGYGFANG